MVEKKEIIKFIGESVMFDEFGGGYVWGLHSDGSEQMIAEVRGYGAIQNLFKEHNGFVDSDKSDEFQDAMGKFIAEAINEKIEREKNS